MNNLYQLISIFLTVLSGVIVFVIGQFVLEIIIKPLKEYRNLKSQITSELKYYSNIICNPVMHTGENISDNKVLFEKYIETGEKLRRFSCDIEARYYDNNSLIRRWFIKDNISDAGSLLIMVSNSLLIYENSGINHAILNSDNLDKIKKYLNIK